jgi:hypothetical protein
MACDRMCVRLSSYGMRPYVCTSVFLWHAASTVGTDYTAVAAAAAAAADAKEEEEEDK